MHSECTRNSAREKLPTSIPSPGTSMLARSTQTRSAIPTGVTRLTRASESASVAAPCSPRRRR
jgi:hypothetical protein